MHHALIEQYLAGPGQLRAALTGLDAKQLDARPIPGKWSIKEVICHIADYEPVYADRMKRVIAEDQPTLLAGSPDAFVARLAYDQRDVDEELALIEIVRKQMARILRSLPPEGFQRTGIHSVRGPVALESLLQQITDHIPHHLAFVEDKKKAMGVGP
jgi:uncharacterized damage-inducible protein DinB